jgi:hypothetical protein
MNYHKKTLVTTLTILMLTAMIVPLIKADVTDIVLIQPSIPVHISQAGGVVVVEFKVTYDTLTYISGSKVKVAGIDTQVTSGAASNVPSNNIDPESDYDILKTVTLNVPAGTDPGSYSIDIKGKQYPEGGWDVQRSFAGMIVVDTPLPTDATPPIISHNIIGTLGDNGWYTSDVTVSWTVTDPESSITSTSGTTPVSVTTDTSGTTVSFSATSAGGTSTDSVTIKRDATAPTISALRNTDANEYGWNDEQVTVSFKTSDVTSGVDISRLPSDVTLGEGKDQSVTGIVYDLAGNHASATIDNINIDLTAPTIDSTRIPAANANGWNNDDVTVTFSGYDSLSGLLSVSDPATLSSEGASQSATGIAIDKAGNTASKTVDKISIDLTAPIISGHATTLPNDNDWYNHDVIIQFDYSDALSGISDDTKSKQYILSNEGASQSKSCTVYDKADNPNSATVGGINIDKTKPVTKSSLTGTTGLNDWFKSDVTVTLDASDSGSAVDVTYYSINGGQTQTYAGAFIVSTESDSNTVVYWSLDKAGNTEDSQSTTIKIDKTAPSVTLTAQRVTDSHGWYNHAISWDISATDVTSGVLLYDPESKVVNYAGIDTTSGSVSASATDNAGNIGTGTASFKYDATAPTVTIVPDRSADHNGWYNHAINFKVGASDATSGVASRTADFTYTSPDDDTASVSAQATDEAGNVGYAKNFEFKYDATAPTITGSISSGDTFILNQPITCSWTTDDKCSGMDGSCPPAAIVCTTTVGTHTLSVPCVYDCAGNPSVKASITYKVTYSTEYGGKILQPLEQVTSPGGLSKSYKQGSTLPIKFQLCDYYGKPVGPSSPLPSLAIAKLSSTTDSYDAVQVLDSGLSNDNGIAFRYDSVAQQYVFNLSTKQLTQGTYRITVTLDDSSTIVTYFQLKK